MKIKIEYSGGRIIDFILTIPVVPKEFEKYLIKYLDEKKHLIKPMHMIFTDEGVEIYDKYCTSQDVHKLVEKAYEQYTKWRADFEKYILIAEIADFTLAYRKVKQESEVQDAI